MAQTGFIKKKDISKLTIESLYKKCDLILVPNEELKHWLFISADKKNVKLNSVIKKRVDKKAENIYKKLSQFKCIGIHFKKNNSFLMRETKNLCTECDLRTFSSWTLDFNGKSYKQNLFAEYDTINVKGDIVDFNTIRVIKDNNEYNENQLTESIFYITQYYDGFVNYYGLNPFIIYEDTNTESAESTGNGTPHKKRENNVVPLTLNHIRLKIKNGVNVMNTETGRIYPSIAEAARELNYDYSSLWNFLINNWMTDLKRIEKLRIININ